MRALIAKILLGVALAGVTMTPLTVSLINYYTEYYEMVTQMCEHLSDIEAMQSDLDSFDMTVVEELIYQVQGVQE